MTTVPPRFLAFKRAISWVARLRAAIIIALPLLGLLAMGCTGGVSEINVTRKANLSSTQRIEIYEQIIGGRFGHLHRANIVERSSIARILEALDSPLSLEPGSGHPDRFHLHFIGSTGRAEVMAYSRNGQAPFLHGPQAFWHSQGIVPPEAFVEAFHTAIATAERPTPVLSDSMVSTVASLLVTRYGLKATSYEFDWKRTETIAEKAHTIEYTYISDQWIVAMSWPVDREPVYMFEVKTIMVDTGKEWRFLVSSRGELSEPGW